MNKKAIYILTILSIVVLISGCTQQQSNTKLYSKDGISFSYPADWEEASYKPYVSAPNSNTFFSVYNYSDQNYTSLSEAAEDYKSPKDIIKEVNSGNNFTILSERNITVNGLNAVELVVTSIRNGKDVQRIEITLEKTPGKEYYHLTFLTLQKDFEQDKQAYNTIINSFKI